MKYNHELCEDEDDAARMAETILRELGYTNAHRGAGPDVHTHVSAAGLVTVARYSERIARWARKEAKEKIR